MPAQTFDFSPSNAARVAGLGYLDIIALAILSYLLMSNYAEFETIFLSIVAVPALFAEVVLCFWLLFRAVNLKSLP